MRQAIKHETVVNILVVGNLKVTLKMHNTVCWYACNTV